MIFNTAPASSIRKARRVVLPITLGTLTAALLLVGGCQSPSPQAEPVQSQVESPPIESNDANVSEELSPQLEAQLQTVRQVQAARAVRIQAVVDMLTLDGDAAARLLADELTSTNEPTTRHVIVQAIALRAQDPPARLGWALFDLCGRADDAILEDLAAAIARFRDPQLIIGVIRTAEDRKQPVAARRCAIRTMAYYRERDVAGRLIDLMDSQQPVEVQKAAAAAMVHMTGRSDLADNGESWRRWWREQSAQPRELWLDQLIRGLSDRSIQLTAQLHQMQDRFVDSLRQRYRNTPQAERQASLIAMLSDPLQAVRELAVDLTREWINDEGNPATPPLREALLARLDDSSEKMRRSAALLLENQRDEPGAVAVARKLADHSETSVNVLRVYLLMMARLPQPAAVDAMLDFLSDESLRGDAAVALVAAVDRSLLTPAQVQAATMKLRAQLRDDQPPEPNFVELLGRIGDEADWQRIRRWLSHPNDGIKRAAARTWARSDRPLAPLAERADDPIIQPIFIEAAKDRGNKSTTLMTLVRHRPGVEEAVEPWRLAVVAVAGRVSPSAVVEAYDVLVEEAASAQLRRQVLSAALEPLLVDPAGLNERIAASLVDLLLTRAEVFIELGNNEAAISDQQRIASLPVTISAEQSRRRNLGVVQTRLIAGEVDSALELSAQIVSEVTGNAARDATLRQLTGTLLRAARLNLNANQPQRAAQIIAGVESIFGDGLPRDHRPELEQLKRELTAPKPSVTPTSALPGRLLDG